jgi:hypothetical protein
LLFSSVAAPARKNIGGAPQKLAGASDNDGPGRLEKTMAEPKVAGAGGGGLFS